MNLALASLQLDSKKLYWSPSVRWKKNDDKLQIEMFSYPEYIAAFFPKFFFLTQNGIFIDELFEEFSTADSKKLSTLVADLVRKRILITGITSPQEIFFPQTHLFKNDYSESILYNADELEQFKNKMLNRNCISETKTKIKLTSITYPDYISQRRTYRTFSKEKIPFEIFSRLLSAFKQTRANNSITYYYGSAGGLYPLDVYLYIKENRVENLKQGIYYYSPVDNSLNLVNDSCVITDEAHFFTNKEVFNESAFSVFLIYNAEVTMPKYGGMGYFYSCIDSGLMVGVLTQAAELCNIGLCSIGDMNFKKIEKSFNLNENQVWIHVIEGGYKQK